MQRLWGREEQFVGDGPSLMKVRKEGIGTHVRMQVTQRRWTCHLITEESDCDCQRSAKVDLLRDRYIVVPRVIPGGRLRRRMQVRANLVWMAQSTRQPYRVSAGAPGIRRKPIIGRKQREAELYLT
jgi:hypothetical protein